MNFYRIEPFQHETLYVLSEDGESIDRIANNPICFSPIGYKVSEVESGDIPAHAKIVSVDSKSGRVKRINLEIAIKMSQGQDIAGANDITAAIETLKAAFQRNGLDAPVSIQLQDSDQALKLAMLVGGRLSNGSFANLVGAISAGQDGFLVGGIRFSWPIAAKVLRMTKLLRLRRALGLVAGGELRSATDSGEH